jgi:N-acetylglucosamine-6-sulfatase
MTDDQTLESMKVMSNTTRLLGSQGTTFQHAFATFPLCCPSRATYLSGQYPHNHGVIHNAGPFGGYTRFDHTNALPVWLQRAGYHTIQLGRYLNGYGQSVDPTTVPPGWSDWNASTDPSTFNYRSWRMNENGQLSDKPDDAHPDEYQTDFYARRAAELIKQAAPAPQPFFLSLTFAAPHSGRPLDPDDLAALRTPSPAPRHRDRFAAYPVPRPPSFDEPDVRDKPQPVADWPRLTPEQIAAIDENYRQELETLLSVDEAVAAVVGALEETGELGNTLILYTSDNGFMHGEHRRPSEKVLPYEESIRVPLLMRGPGVPRGRSDRRLVGNIDYAATILDAAHALPGRLQDGLSLLRLVADPRREWGRDVLLENGRGANGVPMYRGIRTYRFVYVRWLTSGEEELYDLRRDRFELRNLAYDERYDPIRRELSRRLRRLRGCRGAGCRARPRLGLLTHGRTRSASRRRRCLAGALKVRVRGSDARSLERIDVFLGRRRVAWDRHAPFLQKVPLRRFRGGREARLRVRATSDDGRVLTLHRRLLACR